MNPNLSSSRKKIGCAQKREGPLLLEHARWPSARCCRPLVKRTALEGTHDSRHSSPSLLWEGTDLGDGRTDRRPLVYSSVHIRISVVSLQVYLILLALPDPPYSTKRAHRHSAMQRKTRKHLSPAAETQNRI